MPFYSREQLIEGIARANYREDMRTRSLFALSVVPFDKLPHFERDEYLTHAERAVSMTLDAVLARIERPLGSPDEEYEMWMATAAEALREGFKR